MKLYNTQTRKLETVKPLNPSEVTLYTCGPTVYLESTIGNWRTFIFYDTLIRALKLSGYKIKRVMNITDVGHLVGDGDEGEDKIKKAAKAAGRSATELADYYTKLFLAELKLLYILTPKTLVKASDHIKQQILLIEILETKGYTYQIKDGVYFDTAKAAGYPKLGNNAKGRRAGARVKINRDKKQPADFALWKLSDTGEHGELVWDSPWGKGYPGWHLECSAMALEYLGKTMDIHAGGVDHIGTHHPNEIAQSEAATGQPFANLWVHGEFLQVEGQKMAKSTGNFYTLSDVVKKGYHPLAFRLLVLQAHYQKQLNFTWRSLTAAQNYLETLYAMADRQFQTESIMSGESSDEKLVKLLDLTTKAIITNLQQNLDTAAVLANLSKVAEYIEAHALNAIDFKPFNHLLKIADRALGLGFRQRVDISDAQKALIVKRDGARTQGEFKIADELRQQLVDDGIELYDTAHGTHWRRRLSADLQTDSK